jgi:hypothetical protein
VGRVRAEKRIALHPVGVGGEGMVADQTPLPHPHSICLWSDGVDVGEKKDGSGRVVRMDPGEGTGGGYFGVWFGSGEFWGKEVKIWNSGMGLRMWDGMMGVVEEGGEDFGTG